MQTKIFAIRDSKAEMYHTPFFQKTHGEAERTFRELINDERSMPSKYSEDYDLYYLGTYNDITGLISPVDTPQHIIKGVNLKTQQKPNTAQIDPSRLKAAMPPLCTDASL